MARFGPSFNAGMSTDISVLERTSSLSLLKGCTVCTGEAAGRTLAKYSTVHFHLTCNGSVENVRLPGKLSSLKPLLCS